MHLKLIHLINLLFLLNTETLIGFIPGTKVLVWGGRQGSSPEKPDCLFSTEEFDLDHPELGWILTEHNDSSLCKVFICDKHEKLEVNCK